MGFRRFLEKRGGKLMGNPWLERLKEYKSIHNTHTTFREDHTGESGGGGKNGNTYENPLDEIDRTPQKKSTKRPLSSLISGPGTWSTMIGLGSV
jgi:hypothetical protein